jgi:CheY-like chemotaxis protein
LLRVPEEYHLRSAFVTPQVRREGGSGPLSNPAVVLLVEDSPEDIFLFRRALKVLRADVALAVVPTATAASLYLKQQGEYEHAIPPNLIVSDSKFDGEEGTDLLLWVRVHPRFKEVPFIMFTGDANPRLANEAMHLGATIFMLKPTDFQEYVGKVREMIAMTR